MILRKRVNFKSEQNIGKYGERGFLFVKSKKVKPLTVCFFIFIFLVNLLVAGCSSIAAKEVVAKVNGEEIEKKEVEKIFKVVRLFSGPDADETFSQEGSIAQMEEGILWFLIENKIARQELEKLGLADALDEAKAGAVERYEQAKEDLIENIYGSEEDLNSRLKELEIDENALKDFYLKAYCTEFLFEHKSKEIGEKEALAFVEENPMILIKPAQVYAYHILLEDEEAALEVRRLLEEGADFVETGQEHSLDSYVELGQISANDFYDPDFLKAAFSLTPEEISQPVKTSFGYHLIKITEKKEEEELTFEEVKDSVLEMKRRESFNQYFQMLFEEADIDTFDQESSEDEMHKTPSQDE